MIKHCDILSFSLFHYLKKHFIVLYFIEHMKKHHDFPRISLFNYFIISKKHFIFYISLNIWKNILLLLQIILDICKTVTNQPCSTWFTWKQELWLNIFCAVWWMVILWRVDIQDLKESPLNLLSEECDKFEVEERELAFKSCELDLLVYILGARSRIYWDSMS